MIMNEKYKNYLRDLVRIIVDDAKVAKDAKDAKLKIDPNKAEYEIGQLMTYYGIVSLIQQQAELFDLSFEEIGMPNINPETDLL